MSIIKNIRLFNGEVFVPLDAIRFENGRIQELYTHYDGQDAIDAHGAILAPGFIDLHIHGSFGMDVLAPGGTAHLVNNLPRVGTTAFCPTNATDSFEKIHHFLGEVRAEMAHNDHGTRILGAHIEGPFFNIDNRGAHAIPMLQDPTMENYKAMAGEYEDVIARVSLAPEKKGGMELVRYLAGKGVVVSAAHTDADAQQMEEAIANGLTMVTHTFNGMYAFHHRKEGAIGVTLTDDRITCEFIPDLQHINKYAAMLIMKAKGFEKTFICSDALEPAHMGEGRFQMAGQEIYVKDGAAHMAEDGRLAGSIISPLMGVRNLLRATDVTLAHALKMGTSNPAKAIGDDSIGLIQVGKRADFVLLSEDLQLQKTYIRGKLEYSAE